MLVLSADASCLLVGMYVSGEHGTVPRSCRVGLSRGVGVVQEKLRLGEDDEVAIEWMQQLIHDSSSNAMAGFMEATHRIAQALR